MTKRWGMRRYENAIRHDLAELYDRRRGSGDPPLLQAKTDVRQRASDGRWQWTVSFSFGRPNPSRCEGCPWWNPNMGVFVGVCNSKLEATVKVEKVLVLGRSRDIKLRATIPTPESRSFTTAADWHGRRFGGESRGS